MARFADRTEELKMSFFDLFNQDFTYKTIIMGVLNVTPDSFSDGGKFLAPDNAISRAQQMIEEGADIIDIGGESSRPGSVPVSEEEELNRIIPVLDALTSAEIPISVDTYKANVAEKALAKGASIINDISGLNFDPELADVVAEHNASIILMHTLGKPKTMQKNIYYDDVIEDIHQYLENSIETAMNAGISEENIVIDPGIGFGKTIEHNLEIIKRLKEFSDLNKPILIGTSRKSFIGKILDLPVEDRLEGTLATLAVSIMNGAKILRVHDVKESKRVTMMVDKILYH
jgi:dihydropteroate synthase